MGQLFPRFFSTHNPSDKDAKADKRCSKTHGQSFPFQSLSDRAVKSTGFTTTEYEDDEAADAEEIVPADERYGRMRSSTLNLGVHRVDGMSAGSEEWICSPTEGTVAK